MRSGWNFPLALCLTAATAAYPSAARAGVFDDEFAREQLRKTQAEAADFREQTGARFERLESALKMQTELANQLEGLRAEVAKLRGQLEVTTHEIETGQKRQRDFYVDLDARLRKVEGTVGELSVKAAEPVPAPASAPAKPKVDPAAETRAYEDAINLIRDKRYKDAVAAFEEFVKTYSNSGLIGSARFWLGNSLYAMGDCARSIEVHSLVVAQHPDNSKAPDAMLAIATCQQDLKDAKGARKTLEQLVSKHPASPAAETARQRLKRK